MKAKVDLEKFICSYVKWNNIQDALKDQGLKCLNGEIVEIPQESEDERIKKEILDLVSISGNGNQFEEIKDWLEKQGEQKVPVNDFKAKDWYVSKVDGKIHNMYHSVDKVEPKFKVGDWVVDKDDKEIYYITRIEENFVIIVDINGDEYVNNDNFENYYRLWTIEDAKDGDVLACKIDGDSYILIYKQIKDGWIETYGHYYNAVDRFCVPSQMFCRDYQSALTPATKEQCDLLFNKMEEAGYEWDAEKRELKKIEQELVKEELILSELSFHKIQDILKDLGLINENGRCFYTPEEIFRAGLKYSIGRDEVRV